jgi:hypothetical protein
MALPPIHFLVGAACGEAVRGRTVPAWKAWTVGGFLGVAPDAASAYMLLSGSEAPLHGLYSHTIIAVMVVGALGYAIGGRRWGLLAAMAWGSHILVDLLRKAGSTSVYLFGPFHQDAAGPIFRLIPHIPFDVHQGGAVVTLYGFNPLKSLIIQVMFGVIILGGTALCRQALLREQDSKRRRRQVAAS